jgi:putative RNA 2'-phosphotransferase
MKDKDVSKLLSLVLRHQPETIGIVLDPQGWTDVGTLLRKMQAKGMPVDLPLLKQVVATNDKQRFAFNPDFSRIRANQGHSVAVDLGLTPVPPPEYLYHGTAEASLSAILAEGLRKQSRRHVHLSADIPTAIKVGGRHGKPVVLLVKSGEMHRLGNPFYRSENNVWLTDFVAPEYLEIDHESINPIK